MCSLEGFRDGDDRDERIRLISFSGLCSCVRLIFAGYHSCIMVHARFRFYMFIRKTLWSSLISLGSCCRGYRTCIFVTSQFGSIRLSVTYTSLSLFFHSFYQFLHLYHCISIDLHRNHPSHIICDSDMLSRISAKVYIECTINVSILPRDIAKRT